LLNNFTKSKAYLLCKTHNTLNIFIFFFLISLILFLIKIYFLTPYISGYDSINYWLLGKSELKYINHGSLRWGSYLPFIFFQKEGFLYYYLFNLITFHLAILIFAYLVTRIFGIFSGFYFLLISILDIFFLPESFNFLPEIGSFFVLSLIFLIVFNKKVSQNFFLFSLLLFYLYGIKETNLFLYPGVIIYILFNFGVKKFFHFIFLFLIFYLAETAFLSFHFPPPPHDSFSNLGRVHELLRGGSGQSYINEMKTVTFNENLTFVDLISRRWILRTEGKWYLFFYIIFFLGCLFSFFFFKDFKKNFLSFILLISFSFFTCLTFFIVSINPLIPAHNFTFRYNYIINILSLAFFSGLPIIFNNFLSKYYHVDKKSIIIKLKKIINLFIFLILFYYLFILIKHNIKLIYLNAGIERMGMEPYNKIHKYESLINRINYYSNLKVNLIKIFNELNSGTCLVSRFHERADFAYNMYGRKVYDKANYLFVKKQELWILSNSDQKYCQYFFDLDYLINVNVDYSK
jgi:hypothetical protein